MVDIATIEAKIQKLVERYQYLEKSHQQLQQQVKSLNQACEELQAKRDLAINSVENVIERLKMLETQA